LDDGIENPVLHESNVIKWQFLPHDATQSAVMRLRVVCPSVCL